MSNAEKLTLGIPFPLNRNHIHTIFCFLFLSCATRSNIKPTLTCLQLGTCWEAELLATRGLAYSCTITPVLPDLPSGPLDHFLLSNRLVLLDSQED